MLPRAASVLGALAAVILPISAWAAAPTEEAAALPRLLALIVFVVAYGFVVAEELIELRKSIPVVLAAGAVWLLVFISAHEHGDVHFAAERLQENLLEYGQLLLFLLAAMTYVNTLQERNVFAALRSYLVARGVSLRAIFWITGAMAFLLSPFLDNLTTALVMGAVVLAIGRGNSAFIVPSCINIVVAANAGGAFSPFGDITTLMVWQKGILGFFQFFALFLPSLTNWLIPAACMSFVLPKGKPAVESERIFMKPWGKVVIALFAVTVVLTVSSYQWLQLPPFIGMMTGLGLLQVCGYFIHRKERYDPSFASQALELPPGAKISSKPFDIFISMKRVEWDTLLFFYGVTLCIGGLAALGYLTMLSHVSYTALGATTANVLVGVASAVVDNIPIMYAVLNIEPSMSQGQWLLVTLTAGVGGSLLSIGSAAGVALMGQARGTYTFLAHLKWTWAIALGFAASVWVHFMVNAESF
jgi:Na+/H+ antiporter NhaD/arsenite permease-like protein